MKFRMLLFIIFICLYSLFAALNLHNATDIDFGFTQFANVPIFLSVTIAFALGTLFMLPFMFGRKKEKKEKPVKEKKKKGKDIPIVTQEPENKPL